jgi:hypothetical protein
MVGSITMGNDLSPIVIRVKADPLTMQNNQVNFYANTTMAGITINILPPVKPDGSPVPPLPPGSYSPTLTIGSNGMLTGVIQANIMPPGLPEIDFKVNILAGGAIWNAPSNYPAGSTPPAYPAPGFPGVNGFYNGIFTSNTGNLSMVVADQGYFY